LQNIYWLLNSAEFRHVIFLFYDFKLLFTSSSNETIIFIFSLTILFSSSILSVSLFSISIRLWEQSHLHTWEPLVTCLLWSSLLVEKGKTFELSVLNGLRLPLRSCIELVWRRKLGELWKFSKSFLNSLALAERFESSFVPSSWLTCFKSNRGLMKFSVLSVWLSSWIDGKSH